jgi:ferrous iron transport protein A
MNMIPLASVGPGQRVRLISVNAGRGLQSRLASMGLVPGVEIEVVRNTIHGPFIVEAKGSRLMLGRGMTHRIMVE